MWGCDYLPIGVSWRGGFFPGSFGHLLIWVLVILLLAFLAIRIFKSQTHNSPGSSLDRIDSLAILKSRFASGEISQEEFVKMKQILSLP
jgi:putative membrane protein